MKNFYQQPISVVLLLFLLLVNTRAFADTSSGWRDFSLGPQEGLTNSLFSLERLELIQPGNVIARVRVKNIGREVASFAVSIALFDADKNLLTAISFAPHYLTPGIEEVGSLEIPGSKEVFKRIKYYQVSILKRRE